jgi:Uncharacterised protein family (UPF0236)
MQMITDAVGRCRQVLEDLVKKGANTEMNPESFRCAIGTIKDAVNELGRKALEGVIANAESADDVVEREGRRHRFKQVTAKNWVTPFGRVSVGRRYYQRDSGGDGFAPIDVRCGMVDRFMTADIEEMAAFTAAMLTPSEVECLLDMALPDGPSAKAISRVIKDVGTFFEEDAEAVEEHITDAAPLSDDGDVLAVSWDGVMVATRNSSGSTAWREAGVATISIYNSPDDDSPEPDRVDARYFARMPESGMTTLIAQVEHQVSAVQQVREFREIAVLCDGKDTIWDTAEQSEVLAGAIHILDFYHASSYVSGVANAIYGEGTSRAESWHQRWRDKLQLDDDAVPKLIRTIKRAMATTRKGTKRHDVLRRAVNFLGRNAERMRYAEFIALGLPIGSGPVESACKNIVNARLKRSGMRWSMEGGQNVLNLRVHLKSDRWEPAWSAYLSRAA